jgi:hypothetical protein
MASAYILAFYVPIEHAERVKQALFELGVGKLGHYDCCAWQTEGMGQFRALEGSQPFVGAQGEIHQEPECKVEMFCSASIINLAIETLLKAHPYEVPAYYYFPLADLPKA